MSTAQQNLEAIQDIRRMMERSSRFISLSGWSGVAAGISALVGAGAAWFRIREYYRNYNSIDDCVTCLRNDLLLIALAVLLAAVVSAVVFTFLKSKKQGVAFWGPTSKRLIWNTLIPLVAGGLLLLRLMELKQYDVIAGGSLIVYGLALINGSKYTLGEIRYLGYAELITGIISLWLPEYGLYFWAFGFGLLHIIYGFTMWWKYDYRKNQAG